MSLEDSRLKMAAKLKQRVPVVSKVLCGFEFAFGWETVLK
jgi:hypothetical protein